MRTAPLRSLSLLTSMKRATLLAKNREASSTPTKTPSARLWVATTTATVATITMLVEIGWVFRLRTDSQENVPIETMIITATSAAMGIWRIHSSMNTTIRMSSVPATKVERRPRPPDLMLMMD
ncbi:hypothetical protein D3C86_1209300 [compost metagenome]